MISNPRQSPVSAPSGLDAQGLALILFRHKWKILLLTLAGIASAAYTYLTAPPVYESSAKLLVRYVLERSAIDSVDSKDGTAGLRNNDGIINSELEILTSWDLATEVADAVGVERLVPNSEGPATKTSAAASVSAGLGVAALKGSNVIAVNFRHQDGETASLVLSELLNRYFTKHLEVHRSVGAFDFVTQQTDQVRGRLRQTEEELKQFKSKAGIISLPESTAAFGAHQVKSQEDLLAAEAERAEQLARVKELEKWLTGGSEGLPEKTNASAPPKTGATQPKSSKGGKESADTALAKPPGSVDVQTYQALNERLAYLRQHELELLAKFTPENSMIQLTRKQIGLLEQQRHELETRFPSLVAASPSKTAHARASQIDLVSERAKLSAIEAKTEILRTQVRGIQDSVKQFADTGTQIAELERRREVEEANFKYFESSLEKARIDEALDPSKIPNINIVQKPSPAVRVIGQLRKRVLGIAAGGLGLGIALALLIDLVIDKSVKAPGELESRLQMRVLRSIPMLPRNGHPNSRLTNGSSPNGGKREGLRSGNGRENGSANRLLSHRILPFCGEIRDRIILHFEVHRLNHKPKLIAVTGCSEGVGTSTIAAGLAASLSETGDDKVLLVDMNMKEAKAAPIFQENEACLLTDAIEPGKQIASAADNLYLATAAVNNAAPVQIGPKKFYDLLPRLKSSDFDYIIFDMPPLSKSSATIAMAGFMDKTILIVEAEKDKRDAVKRAYDDLVAARAEVSTVVNKTRSYAPVWLGLDV